MLFKNLLYISLIVVIHCTINCTYANDDILNVNDNNLFSKSNINSELEQSYTDSEKNIEKIYYTNNSDDHKIDYSDIRLLNMNQEKKTLEEYIGNNIYVLYFWASWCLECVIKLQSLNNLGEKLVINNINDIKIISISIDFDNLDILKSLYIQYNIHNITSLIDKNKTSIGRFMVTSLPTTFILDNRTNNIMIRLDDSLNWNEDFVYKSLLEIKNNLTLTENILPELIKQSTNNEKSLLKYIDNNYRNNDKKIKYLQ